MGGRLRRACCEGAGRKGDGNGRRSGGAAFSPERYGAVTRSGNARSGNARWNVDNGNILNEDSWARRGACYRGSIAIRTLLSKVVVRCMDGDGALSWDG